MPQASVRRVTEKRWVPSGWIPSVYCVLGQAGWFAGVLSAARGAAWIGTVFALLLICAHLSRVRRPLEELKLVASVLVIGGVWESVLMQSHLLAYPSGSFVHGVAPLWIVALWGLFAAQFNTTYRWLKPHPLAAALLGAVAGPLSFRAGAALGAVRFVKPGPAVAALVLGWAVLLPLLSVLAHRWDGVNEKHPN